MPGCSCRHRFAPRAQRSPRRDLQSNVREGGRRPVGIRERDAVEPDRGGAKARGRHRSGRRRHGRLDQCQEAVGNGDAIGARMEPGSEIAQRQVELRREHEHGQRRFECDPALDQPDPDGDCDERDAERRRELEHGSREECEAQRSHRRRAVGVARLLDPPELRLATIERSQRRQPANDIEEVRRQQRHRLPALACPVPGGPADQPEEHGHEGQREQHQARGDEIERGHQHEHRDRHHDREHELRERPAEQPVQGIDAGDRGSRDLGALGSVERGGVVLQPCRDEIEAQLRQHP